jgi:hypothetical protein
MDRVGVQQEKMDRVGFEPMTSAMPMRFVNLKLLIEVTIPHPLFFL